VFLPVAYAGISKGRVYVGKVWITGDRGLRAEPQLPEARGFGGEAPSR